MLSVRARMRLSLAAGAAVLGAVVYLAFASRDDDPEGGRPEPIIVETRERPARERGDRTRARREGRRHRAEREGRERPTPDPPPKPSSGSPGMGFAPPPPTVAPQVPDEDDVGEDDADDDVGAVD
jgi:hypothetical protein